LPAPAIGCLIGATLTRGPWIDRADIARADIARATSYPRAHRQRRGRGIRRSGDVTRPTPSQCHASRSAAMRAAVSTLIDYAM
jgi:hypothetical protein